ncbi:hypothetical protein C7293_10670 [filamentous cyanobacterium CCT1]|nr:hypothetical protein C7293_10670 [filamentous cyanobacterium CCT1]PSN79764.1 hypothetical protein C8B47_10030 [filamentous cyanobacterium CCP4]
MPFNINRSRFWQNFVGNIVASFHDSLIVMAKLYGMSFLGFMLAWAFTQRMGLTSREFAADPAASLRVSPFMGMLSNLGVVLWTSTAAITLFSAFLARSRFDLRQPWTTYLGATGLLTTLLMLDDLFMLHESYAFLLLSPESPWLKQWGPRVFDRFFYAVYFGLMLLYILKFRRLLLTCEPAFFGMALLFFAGSMAADLISGIPRAQILIEDGLKFMGIVSWLACFSRTCYSAIAPSAVGISFAPKGYPIKRF